jgi:hypothetical protein
MNQIETLELMTQYKETDRQTIKANLKRLMIDYKLKPNDIIALGFQPNNVYAWTNQTSTNIPMFEQALLIAVKYDFDIKEFLKNISN